MPPKVLTKKASRPTQTQPLAADPDEPTHNLPLTQKWDLNLRSVAQNSYIMSRVHTLTSILAGVIAGLFNAGLYSGIFSYLMLYLLITLGITLVLGRVEDYFMKRTDLLDGLGSGFMVFLCLWIITYNLVYTL